MRENLWSKILYSLLLVGLSVVFTIIYCGHNDSSNEDEDYCECEVIEDSIASNDSCFTSVEDVMTFRNKMTEEYQINEILRTISETTLRNVVTVLLTRDKPNGGVDCITKQIIVDEYLTNKDIYDNLEPINRPDTSVVLTYKYKTDTTDSGVRRELIKEEIRK